MINKGRHLLVDCQNVSKEVCLDDEMMLNSLAASATKAGARVISQMRYHLGHNSPPGFTCAILLDESHCTCHTYAELGLMAIDMFTCGSTDPYDILKYLNHDINLGEVTTTLVERFFPLTPFPREE